MRPIEKLARRLDDLEKAQRAQALQPQLAYSSIEDGSLEIYDGDELRQVIGRQDDGSVTVVDVNGAAPAKPMWPDVSVAPGLMIITSYGLIDPDETATDWQRDFHHLEVHVGSSPSFTPTPGSKVAEFGRDGGSVTVALDEGFWYAIIIAVNTSGVQSEPSWSSGMNVPPPATSGGGGSGVNVYRAASAPVGLDASDTGSLWIDTSGGNRQWYWDGDSWELVQLGAEAIADAAIVRDKLEDGAVGGTKLSADALYGKTIEGALIRTAASGQRWVLSSPTNINLLDAHSGVATEQEPGGLLVTVDDGVLNDNALLIVSAPQIGPTTSPARVILSTDYDSVANPDGTATAQIEGDAINVLGERVDLMALGGISTNRPRVELDKTTGVTIAGDPVITLDNDTDIVGELDVTGKITTHGDLVVYGSLSGDQQITHGLDVGTDLDVSGTTNLGTGNGLGAPGDTNVLGDLTVVGNISSGAPFSSRYMGGAFTMTTATWEKFSFGTMLEEAGFTFASGTWTCTVAGIYMVNAAVAFQNNATGRRIIRCMKNTTTELFRAEQAPSGNTDWSVGASKMVRLAVGDTIHLEGYQSSGANLNTIAGENQCHAQLLYLNA